MEVVYTNGSQVIYGSRKCKLERIFDVIENKESVISIKCGKLYINELRINNLSGIGKFINLRSFDCSRGDLKSVEELAECKNLEELCCGSNRMISLRDLSEIACNLKIFDCSHSKLKNLSDICHFSNLIELTCDSNSLKSLDGIQECKALRFLSCNSNNIKSLRELETLSNIDQLYCSINFIDSLDGIQKLSESC